MTTKTSTSPLDLTTVRSIENASWGSGYRGLKVSVAVAATNTAGIPWPTATTTAISDLGTALSTITTLTATRPRLTVDDLLADDAAERTRAAIAIDEGGTRRGTDAQNELRQAATMEMNRLISEAAPSVLDSCADWLLEHQDERHLARLARDLPPAERNKTTKWGTVVEAHAELLRITDPMAHEDLERNESAHRVYRWTDQQWLAFHTDTDTLNAHHLAVWTEWDGLDQVAVDPVRSTSELARRTKHFNDLGEKWNEDNRPKRKW